MAWSRSSQLYKWPGNVAIVSLPLTFNVFQHAQTILVTKIYPYFPGIFASSPIIWCFLFLFGSEIQQNINSGKRNSFLIHVLATQEEVS